MKYLVQILLFLLFIKPLNVKRSAVGQLDLEGSTLRQLDTKGRALGQLHVEGGKIGRLDVEESAVRQLDKEEESALGQLELEGRDLGRLDVERSPTRQLHSERIAVDFQKGEQGILNGTRLLGSGGKMIIEPIGDCNKDCESDEDCNEECSKCCALYPFRIVVCKRSCPGCFPGESLVTMDGGAKKKMENLRIGDNIMTVENGKMVPTRVLGFLDKRINQNANYLKINLQDDKSLFISARHTMFIGGDRNIPKSILAQDAYPGDKVIVETGNQTKCERIKSIKVESKKGAYVPLTDTGTLLVDGVLVSSYTNTDHHWLAHIALTPLRWWPSLLLDSEKTQDMEGIRTVPLMVRKLGNLLGLVTMAEEGLVTMAEAKKDTDWMPHYLNTLHIHFSSMFPFIQ